MKQVRVVEQRKAAFVGDYACQIQLGFPSSEVKNVRNTALLEDVTQILRAARPEYVYLHNLADKHDTHVAVSLRAIAAMRGLSGEYKPKKVYGCEVWRGLDWLQDEDKLALPVSARSNIAAALVGVFDSQVSGGKRYDLATAGRRLANATYLASHGTDEESALSLAMDLTPLIEDLNLPIGAYVLGYVDRLRADIQKRLATVGADA
jgi:LmbE family N-acetylglucosaminyl deacetylase